MTQENPATPHVADAAPPPLDPQEAPPPLPSRGAPRRRWPWITLALLVLNVAAFAYQSLGGRAGHRFEIAFRHERDLVYQGEWWRVIGATFLHGYFFHLAMNMFVHLAVSGLVERRLGHLRYLALYLLSGLGGGLCLQASGILTPGVGASGALAGVLAARVFELLAHRTPRGDYLPSVSFAVLGVVCIGADWLMAWVCEALELGFTIGVSAHAGGFAAGAFLAYVLLPRPVTLPRRGFGRRLAVGVVFLALLAALAVRAALVPPAMDRGPEMDRQIVEQIELGEIEKAAASWRQARPREHGPWRAQGYAIYEALLLAKDKSQAQSVLSQLVESTQAELENRRLAVEQAANAEGGKAAREDSGAGGSSGPDPELLIDLAWYYSRQGVNLQEALALANEAVASLDASLRQRHWLFGPPGGAVRELGHCATTRGWIWLQVGDSKQALGDLKQAVKVHRSGRALLYLALAHDLLGDGERAREAAADAEDARDELSRYEQALLAELVESLGGL